jgi:predicted phosphodiesterase
MLRKSILCISDQHAPYQHPDTLDFLIALKKQYKHDCIVNMGDELDWHSISFHDHHPGLHSPSQELAQAKIFFKELHKVFPNMYLLDSNHGSLVFRKATRHGIPHELFKSYNDMLGVGPGWTWHEDLIIKASNGQNIYFCHGKYKDVLKVAQQYGMCTCQGHYHTSYSIQYWSNPNELLWACQTGCLIDMKSLAFEYNKLQKTRPVIGTAVIINGIPKLIPMVLKHNGRWNRKITERN